ncbi:RNA cyclase family protein [Tanacetum coccineum]
MEAMVNKYQQKFKRVHDDMDRWDNLKSRFVLQIRNASSIIKRLQDQNSVAFSIVKAYRDAKQQLKGGFVLISVKQLNNLIDIKPSLADRLEGLRLLYKCINQSI